MALSRIWSYMILFAVMVACWRYIQGDKNIFNDMVTEKKLKENESFSTVTYYVADHTILLSASVTKLKQANWNITPYFSQAQYIVVKPEQKSTFREQLEAHLKKVKIQSVLDYTTLNDTLAKRVYFDAGFQQTKEASPEILNAEVVYTTAANTDSLRNVWLALINRQKVISSDEIELWLPKNIDGIFETGKVAVTIAIGLIGTLALFMGLLHIAERAGGINLLSRFISPVLSKLFPSVPKGHSSFGHMVMNFSANMLGLDNAATPFGLKAMQSLQELNADKQTASNAQIMFLA